jgi:hypothetical protein
MDQITLFALAKVIHNLAWVVPKSSIRTRLFHVALSVLETCHIGVSSKGHSAKGMSRLLTNYSHPRAFFLSEPSWATRPSVRTANHLRMTCRPSTGPQSVNQGADGPGGPECLFRNKRDKLCVLPGHCPTSRANTRTLDCCRVRRHHRNLDQPKFHSGAVQRRRARCVWQKSLRGLGARHSDWRRFASRPGNSCHQSRQPGEDCPPSHC